MKVVCQIFLSLSQHEIWPKTLPILPRIGDFIQSAQFWSGDRVELRVTKVTWSFLHNEWVPVITLDLPEGKTKEEFYVWYNNIIDR